MTPQPPVASKPRRPRARAWTGDRALDQLLADPQHQGWGNPPLPGWLEEFRPHQRQAIADVVEAYRRGARVVWLDAPTGAGKTAIAEAVRRVLGERGLYVCSGLSLQGQFLRDFDYAALLMGRANYRPQRPVGGVTCAECTKGPGRQECAWCDDVAMCPYEVAKGKALAAPLAVLNTSYLLSEANYVGGFSKRPFVVADEADLLEGTLMGFVSFSVGDKVLEELGMEAPRKGVHRGTILKWLGELREAVSTRLDDMPRYADEPEIVKRRQRWERLAQRTQQVARDLADDETGEGWVRDNDAGPMVLKPVRVDGRAPEVLWRHGERWLGMSATLISTDEMAGSLGLEVAGLRDATVRVPMTFAKDNRPVYVVPVADMSARTQDEGVGAMARAVRRAWEQHGQPATLVHTHSYKLTRALAGALGAEGVPATAYYSAADRDPTLRLWRKKGGVLLAPSLDRGVDLPGEECRLVVVAKVPFPYLGDRQVSARLHGPGGRQWYRVQTARALVQMTGRAVRSEDDWATSYVMDKAFMRWWREEGKALMPAWWAEAVEIKSKGAYQ